LIRTDADKSNARFERFMKALEPKQI